MQQVRRGSRQKEAVLRAVTGHCDHPSADQVFLRVREELPGTSLSTVYRNLGILVEEGALVEIAGPGAEIHYDHTTGNHCHVQCRECGRVCDVHHPSLDFTELLKSPVSNFSIDGVTVTFTGLCPDCRDKS